MLSMTENFQMTSLPSTITLKQFSDTVLLNVKLFGTIKCFRDLKSRTPRRVETSFIIERTFIIKSRVKSLACSGAAK